jgi:hypothetical protein
MHGVHFTASPNEGNAAAISYQQFTGPGGTAVKTEDETSSTTTTPKTPNTSGVIDDGNWGPSLPKPLEKVLPFEPDFTLFLGSPIGLFLTLRGAHKVFDTIRDAHPDRPIAAPFKLPTRSMYNIYSPSDPVAYRIEPLLLPQDTKDLPEPRYLTRIGEDVRLHVRAMQISDEIAKTFSQKRSSLSMFVSAFSEHAQSVLQQIDDSSTEKRGGKKTKNDNPLIEGSTELRFPLAGRGDRLDYQLQPRVIDNEYLSAVTAHSSYFTNTDITDFIMDLVQREEDIIDLTTDETIASSIDFDQGRTTAS